MKKLFTLALLAVAVLYFSPAANAHTAAIQGKHKHKHHNAAHKSAHKHVHGHHHSKAQV